MRIFSTLLTFCVLGCSDAQNDQGTNEHQGTPWFSNEAVQRGLQFVHNSGSGGAPLFPEISCGGVALFDAEGDGDLDMYLVQGGSVLGSNEQSARNNLYLNDGSGNFTNATDGSGSGDTGYGMGVTTGDYDNDGDLDLYITNVGANTLLRNDGGGTFTDVTTQTGVGDAGWGASAAFFDMDHDGDLDLFVTNYVDWHLGVELVCQTKSGILDYCHPQAYDLPARDVLYENNGNGTFTDISDTAGLHTVWGNGLGVAIGDVNGDGFHDVFVANDEMNNQLWMNRGNGTFFDDALVSGVAVDANGIPKAGMGTDFADIDNDGDLDLLVVNLVAESDSMFMNQGGWFTDGTANSGLSAISRPYTRFGVGFRDFDNDGTLDLYMANGKVRIPETRLSSDYYAEENILIQGFSDGTFEEVIPRGGVREALIHTSRGAAFGDVNGDGGIDIVVVNRDAPAYLLMNTHSGRGGFVKLHLMDTNGAPAQNATVSFLLGTQRIRREAGSSGGYCSAHDPTLHIGVGNEQRITNVGITWSNGTKQRVEDILAGETITIRQMN